MHPLAELLDQAARGTPPAADGCVEVFAAAGGPTDAWVAFTGHLTISTSVEEDPVRQHFHDGDFSGWSDPVALTWLAHTSDRRIVAGDVVLAAPGLGREPAIDLVAAGELRHPRVDQASRHRHDVEVFTCGPGPDGILVIGRGVVGRRELALEVSADRRGNGLGRSLAHAARCLTPSGDIIWAQVAPANAASLRALLAAGFVPICSEMLLVPL